MIISASRRTDIPAFYFDWFLERLNQKEVLVRNPMNFHQVSRIDLSPRIVDCIVFWTKNPAPMLGKLHLLNPYPYYIQFTINPYEKDLETNLPTWGERRETFKKLSEEIGPERVIWRYSPIIFNEKYTEEYHIKTFELLCSLLEGLTYQCNISFLEMYRKISARMRTLKIAEAPEEQKNRVAQQLQLIAAKYGITVKGCGNLDLIASGIPHSQCIDTKIISSITGDRYTLKKDKGQPADCGCATSIDIGTYNTCLNGCKYCYANQSESAATKRNVQLYSEKSPILCSSLQEIDKVYHRKVKREGK